MKSRRPGSIQQRSKGSWQIRYDGHPDARGKRKQLTETVRGTKAEAERVLRQRQAALENGAFVHKHADTVTDYLQSWLKGYVVNNTSLRTQEGYGEKIRGHILPAIGYIPIQTLNGAGIEAMYAAMLSKGLSARTVLHVHRILKQALSHAVKQGLLARNPADAATPPRPQSKQVTMWGPETVNIFLEAAEGSRYRDIYHLAVLTGLRRSELVGLKWENVDLVAARLSVVETLQRINGKGLVPGLPKTKRSRRSIILDSNALPVLHGVRGRQIEQGLIAGKAWRNTGYVFTQPDGGPVDPELVTHDFAAIVRRSALPHLTFHGLRHAYATLALLTGVPDKVVSEKLGHSSIAVTMDIYSHVLPGLQERYASAVGDLLAKTRKPPAP